mmetsp:Transcript_33200/g.76545  ORF Transcript_33200/g.76545 Transcript_33200/m.76545 type:complete len:118 (+) Transcript_33200:1455-1808(+)
MARPGAEQMTVSTQDSQHKRELNSNHNPLLPFRIQTLSRRVLSHPHPLHFCVSGFGMWSPGWAGISDVTPEDVPTVRVLMSPNPDLQLSSCSSSFPMVDSGVEGEIRSFDQQGPLEL